MKVLLFPVFLFFSGFLCAQTDVSQVIARDQRIYDSVDVKAQFPGGDDSLFKFLARNIRYPEAERDAGIQGTLYMKFIIEPDGTITDIRTLIPINDGKGLEKETIRVLKMRPCWQPARLKGKPVRTEYTLPVKFKIRS